MRVMIQYYLFGIAAGSMSQHCRQSLLTSIDINWFTGFVSHTVKPVTSQVNVGGTIVSMHKHLENINFNNNNHSFPAETCSMNMMLNIIVQKGH